MTVPSQRLTRLVLSLALVLVFVAACSGEASGGKESGGEGSARGSIGESTSTVVTAGGGSPPEPAVETLEGSWARVPTSLGGSEFVPLLVSLDDRLLVLFPQNGGGDVTGEIYDPLTDTAVAIADSEQVWRFNPAVAWTGTELLMVGGNNGPGIDDLALAYDPTTDEWRTLSNPPGEVDAGDNSIAGPGVWTGEKLLIWRNALVLDPATETWQAMAAMPGPRRAFPATVWTGKEIVVWGGCDAAIPLCDDSGTGLLTDGAIYEVATDTWRPMAPSPLAPGVHPIGVLTDDGLLFYAGRTEPSVEGAQVARYDPATGTWVELPDPPITPRRDSAATWTGSHFVIWGGEATGNDGAAFDPTTNSWIVLPEPPPGSARDRHAMAWITDRLYIVGGWRTNGPLTFIPE